MDLPKFVQIEPVGECNLRCQMCPIQYRGDGSAAGAPAFMPLELFTRLVDQFPDMTELHLQGLGEPMMHPRFFDMVRYAADRGIRVSTNTNLTLLSPRRAALCIESGLEWLHISIDGATADTYERIRAGGRFARVQRNMELLREAKRARASPLPHLRMVVVVMKMNLDELPDLVRLAAGWSIDVVFVQHLCHDFDEAGLPERYRPMHRFVEEQSLLREEPARVSEQFARAREVAEELHVKLRLPSVVPREHRPDTPGRERCDWPWRGAYFSFQGLVMPCCMIGTPDRLNFGSAGERPVEQIWNGADFGRFREQLDSADAPGVCRSCSLYRGTF